jgi:diguanylate cyclase (GGDEF)-like protein
VKLTRDLPAHLSGELQAEQFRILRTQIPILYAVLSINTGILAFSVYGAVSATLSLVIPGAFASLIAVRAFIWVTRLRTIPSAPRLARYLFSTTLIAGFVSLGLGLWGVALLNSAVGDKPFVPLFIAFGAIACAYCLASLPRAAFATIILAVTPVIVALLTSGVRLQQAAGLNLLLIFLLILRLVVHQYGHLVDSVEANAELKLLAHSDPLTGLPNRRAFIEYLESIVAAPLEQIGRMSVAMIDLDGFKAINDTFGHVAGDAVLIQAGIRIRAACAGCQMVARLGGDEFAAVMLANGDDVEVAEIGKTLVREMSKPFDVVGSQLRLSASIGVATHNEGDTSAVAVMARADVALYEVKLGGGKGIVSFVPSMGMRLRRRMVIEQALRETDPPPQIEVVYQPIYDGRSRQITSFEALARWDHPELGPINPLEFIGVAEQTGTIGLLSEQIFATAIEQATSWAAPTRLALNMSGADLCRPSTPFTIVSMCDHYGFDPSRLEVEVTETSVLSDFNVARAQIDLLRERGIRVALDDFGSGFASISYLKEITFDRVKIDGELIADIIHSPKARRLVQGILQLCSAISVPVTAEKIETEEQLAILVGLGCDRLQGYLLSRPVSAHAAQRLTTARLKVA